MLREAINLKKNTLSVSDYGVVSSVNFLNCMGREKQLWMLNCWIQAALVSCQLLVASNFAAACFTAHWIFWTRRPHLVLSPFLFVLGHVGSLRLVPLRSLPLKLNLLARVYFYQLAFLTVVVRSTVEVRHRSFVSIFVLCLAGKGSNVGQLLPPEAYERQ